MSLEGAIAANRFGLGARPGEIDEASKSPKVWLKAQLASDDSTASFAELPSASDQIAKLVQRNQMRNQMRQQAGGKPDPEVIKQYLMEERQEYLREMAARFLHGFNTAQAFRERLVRFWSNHFVVSTAKAQTIGLIGPFEREAIRPHVAGKFADMLQAVEHHPAMQLYLDNAQSIGPDSVAGKMAGKGLNENLGREILELHTLGVDGGYTQNDVIALAKILTGWSIDRGAPAMRNRPVANFFRARPIAVSDSPAEDGFRFYPPRHEPGEKTLLGKSYAEGYKGGVDALNDLAHNPATAHHIATKLAIHFISDTPPEGSVKRIASVFQTTGGDLHAVGEAIIDDPAAWQPQARKVRTPVEYVTATFRAIGDDRLAGLDEKTVQPLIQSARAMGEAPFAATSPKGYPDTADAWTGSDAVLERVEWANAVANRYGKQAEPLRVADASLGPQLGADTRQAIMRAASPDQGLALLLASPDFQRR
jgi:uncharacterized protein (DUF1800 family)